MINAWIFLAASLATLYIFEEPLDQTKRKKWGKKEGKYFFAEHVEIFAAVLFLLFINFVGKTTETPSPYGQEGGILFAMLFAYLYAILRNRSRGFFVAVLVLAMVIPSALKSEIFLTQAVFALLCVFGVSLFRFFLYALGMRLEYSKIPSPMSGLPVYFVTVAILCLALLGIGQ
ncbi:MAG: hypothetical protein JW893_09630 [Candidatus Omnitrophica bacterium]|nr:hypothetical protein [Candidatus Omnitrophota bacterium]